ncbi:type II toxin-antitoxin system RelE/ParE family toxin [Allofranklinella schreckenbergeri]|uniref:Type II toxin-antitoxin system RelE/ParE family toxin n=1 Tax=Allofranklinella schreckenbergeri TaxID=1076744 RepID=A0A3M6Q7Z1_9BURK|nr:type II toxin-antitoxin system RelE/ParE family toxin [Allofranklinella schreckenbergeri]RMW98760.1 type II toxin-antitoxin system RelE/ParE family toxin [Allofranklinella schreckenbergeri]
MLPIVWTEAARADLLGIVSYVAERNPAAAMRLGRAIEESTWPLPEHPHLFRPGRVPGTREIVADSNYIVVYRIGLRHIEILRVLHARQEYP